MRIHELSELTGVPAASIKFYVREGLLHPGERLSATQSTYDASHARRLELIKALLRVGGLSVAKAREVVSVIEDADLPLARVMGTAQHAISATATSELPEDRRAEATAILTELIAGRGWLVSPENPGLINAIAILAEAGDSLAHLTQLVRGYAPAAERIAEIDLAFVAQVPDRDRKIQAVVVGTVIGGVLLSALRSMAQEHIARSTT